jgi:hypothetical protein
VVCDVKWVDAEPVSVTSFDADRLRRRLDLAEAHGGPEALAAVHAVVGECVEALMSLVDQANADLSAVAAAAVAAGLSGDRQAADAARRRWREQAALSSQAAAQAQAALSALLSGTVAAGDATVARWRKAAAARILQTSDLLTTARIGLP